MSNKSENGKQYKLNKVLPDITLKELGLNIFQYLDFKSVLSHYCKACKSKDNRYSFRYFSMRFGSKSPSFVKELLQGKHRISEKIFMELHEMLDLKGEQFEYYDILYRMEQYPEDSSLYRHYYERFRELRLKKPLNIIEGQYECITSWFIWLIREVASLKGAYENPLWVKKCLNPMLEKNIVHIVEAFDLLKQVDLLVPTEEGFHLPDPLQKMSPKDPRLKLLYKELIELSLRFIKDTPDNRELGAFAIATTPEKYQKVKRNLKEFLHAQFFELDTPAGEASMVVSLSYQLLKLAETHEA